MRPLRTVQEVLDFAISREIEAHDYYKNLAKWVARPEIAEIIEGFALDEVQHRMRLEAVKAGQITIDAEEVGNLGIADSLAHVEPQANMGYVGLLRLGMEKEKRAFRLYTNLAAAAKNPQVRQMFEMLAQEEAQHKLRIEIEYDWNTA